MNDLSVYVTCRKMDLRGDAVVQRCDAAGMVYHQV